MSLGLTLNKIPLAMRLFVLILICSITLVHASNSYAQNTVIKIEVQNKTVSEVLSEIEKQSDFTFFFNNKHVDQNRKVSVAANNSNIFKILDEIFKGTQVKYSVLGKKIILSTEIQTSQQERKKQEEAKMKKRISMAIAVATAAARFVVTKIFPALTIASPSMDTVEAPLKPNQQNQRINTPSAPTVRL